MNTRSMYSTQDSSLNGSDPAVCELYSDTDRK
jgi:hypothetical protein